MSLASKQILKKYSKNKNVLTNILDIPHEILRDEITSFLTIYGNFQLLFVFKNIDINWIYLQNRDFSDSIHEPCKYNAIHLDNGNILKRNIVSHRLLTKTFVMDCYRLSVKDMEAIIPDEIANNPKGYNTPMKLYDNQKMVKLCVYKHFGITNFKLKMSLIRKRKELRHNVKLQENEKLEIWLSQKDNYNKNYNKNMTTLERRILLDKEFIDCNFDIFRRKDSQLCNKFISGEILTKSVEEIVSIMIITKLLFEKGSYRYYIKKHHELNLELQLIKFKNHELSWYDCIYKIKIL